MSNTTHTGSVRRQLLATASAMALLGWGSVARAADADRPQLWIELGGELNELNAPEEKFVPPFILATPRPTPETISPLGIERDPRRGFGEDAKISLQPENSDWIFSAAVRYGRSSYNKHVHQQSYPTQPLIPAHDGILAQYRHALQFIDAKKQSSETHAILDFQAGKDVGLGIFGSSSSSVFNVGVRFAQFGSKSNVAFRSDPDAHPTYKYFPNGLKVLEGGIYHSNSATAALARSFHGVGPSLSWNASVAAAGNPTDGEIAVDWGINAALLFGRQRAKIHHQTTALYHHGKYVGAYNYTAFRTTLYRHVPPDEVRSRSVTVPNIGGFAGLSFRYADAKLSLGYRADFFFNAMDGGIDARKNENRAFYGPFASVSVGLGD